MCYWQSDQKTARPPAGLTAGSARECRVTKWLPGVRPDLSAEQALERFGQAIGQLSAALCRVPWQDAPHDWLTSPHVHPDVPDVAELCRELAAAGISSDLTRRTRRTGSAGRPRWFAATAAPVS
jgi:hypothetical protein